MINKRPRRARGLGKRKGMILTQRACFKSLTLRWCVGIGAGGLVCERVHRAIVIGSGTLVWIV